ncbi:hypothetical protein K9M79_03000 [Candidatus Woesearchaeota archaeon]|nr:hypothetical protein [Candidatus Woesearchaeota archaeon]
MAKKTGRKNKQESTLHERRETLLRYLDNYGYFGVPRGIIEEIAVKYNVTERQVYLDIEYLTKQIKLPAVEKLSKQFLKSYERGMIESHKLIKSDDPQIRAKGIALMNQTSQGFTKFLEDYGYKDKIADKMEFESGNELKRINKDLEELKGLDPNQQEIIREVLRGNIPTS